MANKTRILVTGAGGFIGHQYMFLGGVLDVSGPDRPVKMLFHVP